MFFLSLLVVYISLTACAGDALDVPKEGFEFTDEEAGDIISEPGFDFSDDEALVLEEEQGFDFDEGEVGDLPEMNLDDDQALNLSDLPDHLFLPEGTSNWLIKHDDGTATCPNQTMIIWGRQPETVTIRLGVEDASLVVSGMEGGHDMLFLLEGSGIGGSIYNGYFQPPGANSEVHYRLLFTSLADDMIADYVMGSITGTVQDCYISRIFEGNRVD